MPETPTGRARRWRVALLVLALAAAAATLLLRDFTGGPAKDPPMGMSWRPCSAGGGAATGRPRGDWAGLCVFRADNARVAAAPERPGIVMIGDSLTDEWPGLDGLALNRGIGGQTSAQVLLRFQQDAAALRPRAVHILVGTNDTAGNTGPVSPDMFMANVSAMVAIARGGGIEPVIGTLPPVVSYPWKPGLKPGPWVAELNRRLRDYARREGLILADYHAVLARADGSPVPGALEDGVHLTDAGYAAIRPVLDKAVAQALARSANAAR